MSGRKISVFVVDEENKLKPIAHNIDWAKFEYFADISMLSGMQRKVIYANLPAYSVIIHKAKQGWPMCEAKYATLITTWINTNNIANPTPLTLETIKPDRIRDVVETHRAAYALRIKRELRTAIHVEIWRHIHHDEIGFDDFAMILELAWFDKSLVHSVKNHVMFGRAKGGEHVNPEMDRIEEYAKAEGIWEGMLLIEEGIKESMAARKKEQREEKAAKSRGKRANRAKTRRVEQEVVGESEEQQQHVVPEVDQPSYDEEWPALG